MASVRKIPGSKFWIACFMEVDRATGKKVRRQRSTKETDERRARNVAAKWEEMYCDTLSVLKLTERALETIEENVDLLKDGSLRERFLRVYESAFAPSGEGGRSLRAYSVQWLAMKKVETRQATFESYRSIIEDFVGYLESAADADIRLVSKRMIHDYRNSVVERLSARTANNRLKTIRILLNDARKDGLIDRSPAEDIRLLKAEEGSRRAFTVSELQAILKVANVEWRGMILFGVYTGQRLGDIASLTWEAIDLERNELRMVSRKTQRAMRIPLAAPVVNYLAELPASDDDSAPIFRAAYSSLSTTGRVTSLSNQFNRILASAGLAKAHRKAGTDGTGDGRKAKRATGGLSFHCIRHSATSMLKNAGVSEAVAMDLIGHDSKAVSQNYTHIEDAAKVSAIGKLPDITAG